MNAPAKVLRFDGYPPVDAELWRKFIYRFSEFTTEDRAALPEPFHGIVDRRRHNETYAAALRDPRTVTPAIWATFDYRERGVVLRQAEWLIAVLNLHLNGPTNPQGMPPDEFVELIRDVRRGLEASEITADVWQRINSQQRGALDNELIRYSDKHRPHHG